MSKVAKSKVCTTEQEPGQKKLSSSPPHAAPKHTFQCLKCDVGRVSRQDGTSSDCDECGQAHSFLQQFMVPSGLKKKQSIQLNKIAKKCTATFLNDMLVPILENKWGISLRTVDWFVTNYSKQHHPGYWHEGGAGRRKHVSVFHAYHAQLKNYRRRLFDVFRRKTRIYFLSDNGKQFETTVAQLNFFLWAESHGVLDYCERHIRTIDEHMVTTIRKHKEKKAKMKEQKRCEITPSRPDHVFIYSYPTKFATVCDSTDDEDSDCDDEPPTKRVRQEELVQQPSKKNKI